MSATIRPLQLGDLLVVSQLLRASLPDHLVPYLPLAQAGAPAYLSVQAQFGAEVTSRFSLVAEHEGEPVGFADFRTPVAGTGFLSYICVSPSIRSRGIGLRLILAGLERMATAVNLALDVFDGNDGAARLYERLGFRPTNHVGHWVRRPLPVGTVAPRSSNLPASLAAHTRYGFAMLEVEGLSGAKDIGLMGADRVRCAHAQDLGDDALLASIRALLPERREAFAVLDRAIDLEFETFAVSRRLIASVDAIRRAAVAHERTGADSGSDTAAGPSVTTGLVTP